MTDSHADTLENTTLSLQKKPGKLILVRHTESEWNAQGIWTGLADICLSEKGEEDCVTVGKALQNIGVPIDKIVHSNLKRTTQTMEGICTVIGGEDIEKILGPGFDERNYGEYTGMNKWKVKEELGEEQFNKIRRGWDVHVPNGETLKQVYERVVPEYEKCVLPLLLQGENVMIIGHGNSFRALIKYLDSIPDEEVEKIEMPINQIIIYDIDPETGLKKDVEIIDSGAAVQAKY